MKNMIPTLRTSLMVVIALMGVIAIVLVIITGKIYQKEAIDSQRLAVHDLVKLEVGEYLEQLEEDSITLGLSTNKSRPFREALKSGDKERIQKQLNSQFHQYFVTAGVLQLEKLYLFDRQLRLITSSSEGIDTSHSSSVICNSLIAKAALRKGSDRIKPIHQLCMYDGSPMLSALAPVGGLIPKAYMLVITNPTYTLNKIETTIGLPLQLREPDGRVVYESKYWPRSKDELATSLIADYVLNNFAGETVLTISAARNLSAYYQELNHTLTVIIVSTIVITLLAGTVAILLLWWTAVLPLKKLQEQVHKVGIDKKELGEQVVVKGVPEIVDLASGFNQMTLALKNLYQDLTDSYTQLEAETNEKIQAVSSSEAKSEFLSRMSHELRTPLNAILGFTELMMIDTSENQDSERKEQLAHVYNAGEHLLSLVNELLDLESIESGKLYVSSEAFEADSIINDVLALLKPAADARNIKFIFKQEGRRAFSIKADPARFKQVMINLLSNAVKYNKPNGDITIDITPANNQMYKFSIIDTGPGLTKEEQNQLFIPFSRVGKDVNLIEGTGIGLTITKRFVELMGGEAGVNSVEGEGATFWFTLQTHEEGEGASSVMHG